MGVRRFSVAKPAFSCGAGTFAAGEFVYDPWLDGQADRLCRIGLLAPAGEVEADDPALVPPVALDDLPDDEDEDGDHGTLPDVGDEDDGDASDVLAGSAAEVMAYAAEHPEQVEELLAAEQAGKARKGLLTFLEDAAWLAVAS